jgi:nucleoside-diphosphate-sugar epimerase
VASVVPLLDRRRIPPTVIILAWSSLARSLSTAHRLPNPIPEDFHETPLTSYGTQKAIGELLLADYTRRGFVDGIGIRLPTICIRPGKPNKAAKSKSAFPRKRAFACGA